MYQRRIEQIGAELRGLRQEEREDLGLAALALAFAMGASQVRPALAVPLLAAGFLGAARGVRALWRRWDLVDRLAGEPDAYAIEEVRAYASRAGTPERRRELARSIRAVLGQPSLAVADRVAASADELAAIASELEDDALALEPFAALACARLLTESGASPLLNPKLPPEDVRTWLRRIRAGFERLPLAARPAGNPKARSAAAPML